MKLGGKKTVWLILILACVYYAFPLSTYAACRRSGADVTDAGLSLYLVLIPLLIAILSIVYTLLCGLRPELPVWVAVCGLPTVFMPMMGRSGAVYALAMGALALVCGAAADGIRNGIKKLLDDRRKRGKE